ncbi:uncharacterized protein [Maniola hyperantus]|uniref:uncharacterized protein n=1 Tax=Aphantopus hyperantus TaxID=2795564 RepID=UPI00156A4D8D|nr:uncharacterized protein LOC117995992 [Maniola hyperantus]
MEVGSSPRILTTKRRVKYRASAWSVHEFEVVGGAAVWRVAVLRMERSLLLWAGARAARLRDVALGVPRADGALATALLGAGAAPALARRLAAALQRPALVCTGERLDRLAAPLLERALAAEMKAHPEHF